MSAFMVNAGVIDDVTYLVSQSPKKGDIEAALGDRYGDMPLGMLLYRMNADAVSQRYNDDIDQLAPAQYEAQAPSGDDLQRLKSLSCLMYQAAEGDVYQSDAYQLLNGLEVELLDIALREHGSVLEFGTPQPQGLQSRDWDRERETNDTGTT